MVKDMDPVFNYLSRAASTKKAHRFTPKMTHSPISKLSSHAGSKGFPQGQGTQGL